MDSARRNPGPYAFRMKTMALPLAAAILAGCSSSPGVAEFGRVVQQATDPAPAAGGNTAPGSVASGGTGYLPCAARGTGTPARPECK